MDERARHLLYRKLEAVLGPEEAGTLMDLLPPTGFASVAIRDDLLATRESLRSELAALRTEMVGRMGTLEHRLNAKIEQSARRLVMWTSSMVLGGLALAFAAGRFL